MREQRGSEPMARPGATRAEPGATRRPAAGRMRPSPRRKGPRSRRRRRTRLWHGLLVLALALCLGGGLVAAVPPWRDAALTSALLITGEIGAPTDLPTVTLCRTERPGLHARSARRLSVPRGRVIAGTLAGAALRGVRRPYLIYLPPGYDLPLFATTAIRSSTRSTVRRGRPAIGTRAARSMSSRTGSSLPAAWRP